MTFAPRKYGRLVWDLGLGFEFSSEKKRAKKFCKMFGRMRKTIDICTPQKRKVKAGIEAGIKVFVLRLKGKKLLQNVWYLF